MVYVEKYSFLVFDMSKIDQKDIKSIRNIVVISASCQFSQLFDSFYPNLRFQNQFGEYLNVLDEGWVSARRSCGCPGKAFI